MKAFVIVTPKKSVFDPQGEAVRKAVHGLGMECVESVRIGKYIELEISGSQVERTREKLAAVAGDLLANPVIEDFRVEMEAPAEGKASALAAAGPANDAGAPGDKEPREKEKKKKKDKDKGKKDKDKSKKKGKGKKKDKDKEG